MSITSYVTECKGKKNGACDGESSQQTLASEDVSKALECFTVQYGVSVGSEHHSGRQVSHRTWQPVRWSQRTDKSVPVLYSCLKDNDPMDITVKFFRPVTEGNGHEIFQTVKLEGGRITSVESELAHTLDPASANLPPITRVAAVFRKITIEDPLASKTCTDDWAQG